MSIIDIFADMSFYGCFDRQIDTIVRVIFSKNGFASKIKQKNMPKKN